MEIIDKVAWIKIEDGKVLFVRTRGKDIFYFPGGKREGQESDTEALIREIKEELDVDLLPDTIKYLNTFKTQAHGRDEGVLLETKYYTAEYSGAFKPTKEIEELVWYSSKDIEKVTEMGKVTLIWLKESNLID